MQICIALSLSMRSISPSQGTTPTLSHPKDNAGTIHHARNYLLISTLILEWLLRISWFRVAYDFASLPNRMWFKCRLLISPHTNEWHFFFYFRVSARNHDEQITICLTRWWMGFQKEFCILIMFKNPEWYIGLYRQLLQLFPDAA